MNLYLLRHTRVLVAPNTCYGQLDVPLACTFETEKEHIIRSLLSVQFHRIYSSQLTRCAQLAQALACDEKITYDKRLMELHFGQWEGTSWTEIHQSAEGKQWFSNYQKQVCPGGEGYLDLRQRIQDFYDELCLLPTDNQILIISHGGPLRILYGLIKKLSVEQTFELEIGYGQLIKLTL